METSQLNELKQFITSTVKGEVGILRAEMREGFERVDARFDENEVTQNEVHSEILSAVGEVLEAQQNTIYHKALTVNNHETRIATLEKHAA